jgi:hypothetical protein
MIRIYHRWLSLGLVLVFVLAGTKSAVAQQTDGAHAATFPPVGSPTDRKWHVEFAEGANNATWQIRIYRDGTLIRTWDGADAKETSPTSHWYAKAVNFNQDKGTYAVTAWFQQGNTWYQLIHYPKDDPNTEKFSVTGRPPITITFFYSQ